MEARRSAEDTVHAFNGAISARDLARLESLMTADHRFVDTAGSTIEGREACLDAWRGFFDAFPDYRNVFDTLTNVGPGRVHVTGRSECSEPLLRGPAVWDVVVERGLVSEWAVRDS